MNNITQITKRDIIDLFRDGYVISDWFGDQKFLYKYYGRLSEIEFLKKIYALDEIPSTDPKFDNAEDDIWQHTVNNHDWEYGWFFEDHRFNLLEVSDKELLNFLCHVFNPEYRYEEGYWREYLSRINLMIRKDGYELFESEKKSGRDVYDWREITKEESISGCFIPFSVRNKSNIESDFMKISISRKVRSKILSLFNKYNETLHIVDETNWSYDKPAVDVIFDDIRKHYIPKSFDVNRQYLKTESLQNFIMNNQPYCVFDAIEFFAKYDVDRSFILEINNLLFDSGLSYQLIGGKLELPKQAISFSKKTKEVGLKYLLDQAMTLYRSNTPSNRQLAVEKLWDGFERLKTQFPQFEKKESVDHIIDKISNGNSFYKELFDKEFRELTRIGNRCQIRHHEIGVMDIKDKNYYDYFFLRCHALIQLTLKYLD